MPIHEQLGHAGLQGWREKIADVVAPRAANRVGPVDEDQARALIGGLFFVLSVYYVVTTIARAARRA